MERTIALFSNTSILELLLDLQLCSAENNRLVVTIWICKAMTKLSGLKMNVLCQTKGLNTH